MVDSNDLVEPLRRAGARFGYVHGSRSAGRPSVGSDLDLAAWFGDPSVDGLTVASALPGTVDLLVLDCAPLELAGRVAMTGRLLFDDDPPGRVRWEAVTRKMWLDERPRMEVARRIFVAGARGRR